MSIKYNGKTVAGNYKVSASTTASDTKAGPIKIATEQELKDTTNNKVAVTPYLLNKALNGVNRGLKIGRIGIGFINESQQQERYLNGQVIIQDQFESFTTWVKDLIKLYPNLSCTNEEFENACTLSDFGQCGKFVVDDNAGSIRLPKVVNVQGLFDLTQAGLTVEAGLPNITGSFAYSCNEDATPAVSGVFTRTTVSTGSDNGAGYQGDGTSNNYTMNLNASRSSSIYGNSTTVQHEAVQYPYWIQVATGVEASVDVTREIELNNPYSLGDSKYSPLALNNLSWLKSEGQWNSKAVYPSFYDWALINLNNGIGGFASSTGAYTDYDFVINTANETFRLPLLDGSENIVDYNKGQTFAISTNFTAPVNGVINVATNGYAGGEGTWYWTVNGGEKHIFGGNSGGVYPITVLVSQDDIFWVNGNSDAENNLWFYPYKGNGSLYFYVGETVQNANLINAGRIEEKLAEALAKPHIVETYVNGTSWYRVYSDGWCEQGGTSTSDGQTVTFLKSFSDTNYAISGMACETDTSAISSVAYLNKKTTSIQLYGKRVNASGFASGAHPVYWQASGYIA